MTVDTDCFAVAVVFEFFFEFVFDFHPLLTLPIVRDRKWIKKASLFERSEFRSFPIFCLAQLGTRRAVAAWSPFLGYLFWRSKKGNWLSGHPRPTELKAKAIVTTITQHRATKKPAKSKDLAGFFTSNQNTEKRITPPL